MPYPTVDDETLLSRAELQLADGGSAGADVVRVHARIEVGERDAACELAQRLFLRQHRLRARVAERHGHNAQGAEELVGGDRWQRRLLNQSRYQERRVRWTRGFLGGGGVVHERDACQRICVLCP